MSCPPGFELRTVDGAQRCVSTDDPEISIHLVPQPAVMRPLDDHNVFSIADLKGSNPDASARYSAEADRFEKEKTAALSKVSHAKLVAAAAAELQSAAPGDATDAAKAKYMELTGDPDEVAYQRDKAANEAAQRATDRFISDYQFLSNQATQQQSTLDLINSVKDNLLTVKDDVEFSVGTFGKQVDAIRNQINMNKRKREQATDYGQWLSTALNVAIVAALLFMVFVIGRKAMGGMSTSSASSVGAPARAAATPETQEFFNSFLRHITPPASSEPAKKGWLW
jgi:large-conductance mechanosensitive channel